jgi:hypothetical protein
MSTITKTYSQAPHPCHVANRRAKVERIVNFLADKGGVFAKSEAVASFCDSTWEFLMIEMGEARMPSYDTREAVVMWLRGAESVREALNDPFEGFS